MPTRNYKREVIIEKEPKEKYERFLNSASLKFMSDFKYSFPAKLSTKKNYNKWIVKEKRLVFLKNIFIKAVEDALFKEELILENEDNKKITEEFKEIIEAAKDDLEYIKNEARKKVEEELKYG